MKILSLIIPLMLFQTHKTFVDEIGVLADPPFFSSE